MFFLDLKCFILLINKYIFLILAIEFLNEVISKIDRRIPNEVFCNNEVTNLIV